jgi:hypothetical protein
MLSCPRCIRRVPPDAARCPSCGYDLPAAARAAPHVTPDQVAEVPPGTPLTRPDWVTATPPDDTRWTAPVADDDPGLIPGLAEAPPQLTGPSEQQRRYWWHVGAAAVAALVVLAVSGVLAAIWIGHRGTADATPGISAAFTPTTVASPSGAVSASKSGSASKSASTTTVDRQRGAAQASTIAGYLTSSRQARPGVGAAISAIRGCTNITSAVSALQNAADVRSRIVRALASADVSALPNSAGAAIADLRRAMRASADADRHYAAWGLTVAGCHGHAPHNAEFAAALQSGTAADAFKQRFADEWNPIAAMYGLAKQSANTI